MWPALEMLIEKLEPDLDALQGKITEWWREHKALIKRRVRALVSHGARWKEHLDSRDVPAAMGTCGHHDLKCRATMASSWQVSQVLQGNVVLMWC